MKLVTLTTDLSPWRRGDHVPLPDDMAEKVCASGEAENMRSFPETAAPDAENEAARAPAANYSRREMRPERRGKGYRTK